MESEQSEERMKPPDNYSNRVYRPLPARRPGYARQWDRLRNIAVRTGSIRQGCSWPGSIFLILVWGLILTFGCRVRQEYYPAGFVQTGIASWYGPEFHGQPTSSREVYNMHDLTAAHNSLPIGTYVMVTNLENGRSITVRINDRGPFVKGRVIDLSYAAAKALDMTGPGTAKVRIEVLPGLSPPLLPPTFSVQVGSFLVRENAEKLRGELERAFEGVFISIYKTRQATYYRVRLKARDIESARELALRLSSLGYTAIVFEGE